MKLKKPAELESIVKELKTAHPNEKISAIEVNFNDEVATIFVKKADRKVFDAGSAIMGKNELRGTEVFLRGMYLGGDDLEELLKDLDCLRQLSYSLAELLAIKAGNVRAV
jgi:hypothetical protein